jgi:hypothetical protein
MSVLHNAIHPPGPGGNPDGHPHTGNHRMH